MKKGNGIRRILAVMLAVVMIFGTSLTSLADAGVDVVEEVTTAAEKVTEAVAEILEDVEEKTTAASTEVSTEASTEDTTAESTEAEKTSEVASTEATSTEASTEVITTTETSEETSVTTEVKIVELTQTVDGTTITLSGPASSFEEGKVYSIQVTKIETEEELSQIKELVEKAAKKENKVINHYQAFDINLLSDGVKTQPFGKVEVRFTRENLEDDAKDENIEVYHIDSENAVEDMNAKVVDDTVCIETTHFSTYVVAEYDDVEVSDEIIYQELAERAKKIEAYEKLDDTTYMEALKLTRDVETAQKEGKLTADDAEDMLVKLTALMEYYEDTVAEAGSPLTKEDLRARGFFDTGSNVKENSAEETVSVTTGQRRMMFSSRAANSTNVLLPDDFEVKNEDSDSQIDAWGGEKESTADKVRISKTIDGTDIENVFDITLTLETKKEIVQESTMEVVIVLDVSNTMTYYFGKTDASLGEGPTRYEAAMSAITGTDGFLDQFNEAIKNGRISAESKISLVAFNTDATVIQSMAKCATNEQKENIKTKIKKGTSDIVTASGYANSVSRFTNIEAGLALGKAQFTDDVKEENCFIILLTDGFPTTYRKNHNSTSNYKGYNPYMNLDDNPNYNSLDKTPGTDGYFYDDVANVKCQHGTSYSDTAAIYARQEAQRIKKAGINILSVGVDIGGQTISRYISGNEKTQKWSVVERSSTKYEIGSASNSEAFKNWLRDKIGSGIYYDSNAGSELTTAFNNIFVNILRKYEDGVTSRIVTDVIPDTMEYIGVMDYHSVPVKETVVTYNNDGTTKIEWGELKDGDATQKTTRNNVTLTRGVGKEETYLYKLTYRVRLKNEISGFNEGNAYDTNSSAKVTYKTYTNVYDANGNKVTTECTKSDKKTLSYHKPSVHGYFTELRFDKKDQYGKSVQGAEFTLAHDEGNCKKCRGDNSPVTNMPSYTAVSDVDGKVVFSKIPSGHKYKLSESRTPAGYQVNENTYSVEVAYDVITVTPDDGSKWNGEVVNIMFYELPSTGGFGIYWFMIAGLMLMVVAVYATYRSRRKVLARK